ncbi:MAG: lipoyl(octanoyl) transferase LipB [Desulfobacula sp.]|nr:lipoyl(octanoyl) transferase LipB [Desulfobacula sp.]
MPVRLADNGFGCDSLKDGRLESARKDLKKSDHGTDKKKRFAVFKDLGVLEYNKALELQIQTVFEKIRNKKKDKAETRLIQIEQAALNHDPLEGAQSDHLYADHLFFVEHPSVFTLGKRGGLENLSVSKKILNSRNIDIIKTDRGGNITWHGPGQAVLYPVIDLEKNRIGVKDFVYGLEEIMKFTADDFNIIADRSIKNHGIWVGNAKIGSVGISIKKGISMHGLALNITPDLEPFSWINPCGLNDISMTSLKKELLKNTTSTKSDSTPFKVMHDDFSSIKIMERVKRSFQQHFSMVFDFEIVEV